MAFVLKCDICDQISTDFWVHKLYCKTAGFKTTQIVANKENLLKLFGRQIELLMEGFERGLGRIKITADSSYRITVTEAYVKVAFNSNVYTHNSFEAKILDLGLADHLHTQLGNDIKSFMRNPCQATFELKTTVDRVVSVILTIKGKYYNFFF